MPKKESTKFSLPVLFRKTLGIGMWVQGSIGEDKSGLYAKEYIHAPEHGDQAMNTLQKEIHAQAKKAGRPIKHLFVAANRGSEALIKRTKGYKQVGIDEDGKPIYEKIFKP